MTPRQLGARSSRKSVRYAAASISHPSRIVHPLAALSPRHVVALDFRIAAVTLPLNHRFLANDSPPLQFPAAGSADDRSTRVAKCVALLFYCLQHRYRLPTRERATLLLRRPSNSPRDEPLLMNIATGVGVFPRRYFFESIEGVSYSSWVSLPHELAR